ncbi:MAG: carboxylesterase family protein [Polyangiales bacterium]
MRTLRLALAAASLLAACDDGAPSPAADATLPDAPPPDAAADVAPDAPLPRVTAMSASGPVVGVTRNGVNVFRRIPYAAAPVGLLRFRPPTRADPWMTPLDATGPASVCAQGASLLGLSNATGTEDCLHVNVTTPGLTGSRPVMVWIHGGGFVVGSGDEYDAARLATEGNVVVVTVNYRLGVLGFLAHPALGSATETTGNWGFQDQQAALVWVQANAARFGGDPANVTLFGESAGGTSVLLHLASLESRGLFARAIVQSGPAPRLPPRERAYAIGQLAAQGVGCTAGDVAACLRRADPLRLQAAVTGTNEPGGIFYQERGFVFLPTFDGVTFPTQPIAALRMGRGAEVPVILGTNTDEGTLFHGGLIGAPVTTEAEYRAALGRASNVLGVTPAQAAMIAERYPSSRYPSPNDALTAVTTDGIFACSARYVARAHQAAGRVARLYRFDQAPGRVLLQGLGVFHGAELSFVWGGGGGLLGDESTAPALGTAIRGYWTRFAATGDPGGMPAWPAWAPTADRRLRLASTVEVEPADPDARCDFWSSIYDTL